MVQIKFLQLLQCSIFHNILRTFTALPVLLDILLLTWGTSEDYEIVVKTLNSRYSLWINFFVLLFHNVVSTFTNIVKLDVESDNVDSTLLDVVHFNVEIHNVVSTLIWRCTTSWRRINQKTTLKQRWNVCWVRSNRKYNIIFKCDLLKLCFFSFSENYRSSHQWCY